MMGNKQIAIVGAGVFGSWVALLAAREGFDAILVDQHGPGNELSSSGGSSRIIRRSYGPNEVYMLFADRSFQEWISLFKAENHSHCFRRTGVLWLANQADRAIHDARRLFERHRFAHEFLETSAIRELYCQLEIPGGTVGLLEPDTGALLAKDSVRLVAEVAIRNGARYVKGRARPVQSVSKMRYLEIENGETIEADLFVFACGSWLAKLFPEVLGDAILPTRQELFFFESPANWLGGEGRSMPIWVDQIDPRMPYGFPDIDGSGIKVAFHRTGPPFEPGSGDRGVKREHISEAAEYLRTRFPALGPPIFRHARACHYENTANGDFLIDRHPSMGNVWFAGGGSGHGFKHGPAVARYLLESIQRGESPEPRFRLREQGSTVLAKRL
jgi:sarcosine oxidase